MNTAAVKIGNFKKVIAKTKLDLLLLRRGIDYTADLKKNHVT
jgi:hypothetical protein